jgi:hypothetical protein
MDARRWFLRQHESVHDGMGGVAWLLFHITGADDLGVNTVLRGAPYLPVISGCWGRSLFTRCPRRARPL